MREDNHGGSNEPDHVEVRVKWLADSGLLHASLRSVKFNSSLRWVLRRHNALLPKTG
ncbi:hypothetical protein RHECNPAF_890080 [Rhizobium etli CNPAF512]|nr:hypothetical protein RHECNPAF_890080 [Rhizobium etli CNPAF512]